MSQQILNIRDNGAYNDDAITSIQHHAYSPYTTSFKCGDEIRIAIQQQELYVLPHDSYIFIEGTVEVQPPANATAQQQVPPCFVNNAAAFLFDEIRYELNGVQIDSNKNVGITSLLKGYCALQSDDMNRLSTASWNINSNAQASAGSVNFCIPLKTILGFAEDYQHILLNAKHELILIRSRNDTNVFVGANDISKITINKIQWMMPHVHVSDSEKVRLLKFIDRKQAIPLIFRSWELYEYPALPTADKHVWSVKTSTQLNTPRHIIIAFQTNRNNSIASNKSHFDHCAIRDVKVYLNSEAYPYENMNVNFSRDEYAILYEMYARFQDSYYHNRSNNQSAPLMSFTQFKTIAPLIVIDCSRQNEMLKKSMVDIRIHLHMNENITANTVAYCLIMHDNLVTYNPYTNAVNRMF